MAISTRPLIGKLVLCPPEGAKRVLESNKPFSLLQKLKKEYVMRGYRKEYLKITY